MVHSPSASGVLGNHEQRHLISRDRNMESTLEKQFNLIGNITINGQK